VQIICQIGAFGRGYFALTHLFG